MNGSIERMNNKINVMQGRLSYPINVDKIQEFPETTWVHEIMYANEIGLNGLEWICDSNLSNPLLNIYQINKIKKLLKNTDNRISINTFCMDFLEDIDEIFKKMPYRLLTCFIQAATILVDTPKIVIPLFKKLTPEFVDRFENATNRLMPLGTNYNRMFEIDDFDGYRKIFRGYKICYDIGNRQLCAENICDELLEFEDTIYHIHIKEKNIKGVSVPLGQGIIGFGGWRKIFDTLKKIKYRHDFTLQVARGMQGNETETVSEQCKLVKALSHG